MTREEAKAIIRKEYLCVDRDCGIEKNCGKCDLVMPSKEPILEAFKMAIKALEQEPCEDAPGTNARDMIDRQAAIDAVQHAFDRETLLNRFVRKVAVDALKTMPSAQPEEVIPHRNYKYLSDYWCECGWHLGKKGEVKYCADCGRKVNWDG